MKRPNLSAAGPSAAGAGPSAAQLTGRYLVAFRDKATKQGVKLLQQSIGLHVASSREFKSSVFTEDSLGAADALVFDKLGVALIGGEDEQSRMLGAMDLSDSPLLAFEPERIVTADGKSDDDPLKKISDLSKKSMDDMLKALGDFSTPSVDSVLSKYGISESGPGAQSMKAEEEAKRQAESGEDEGEEQAPLDESDFTWGLQATRVDKCRYNGARVKVAVLDTGLNHHHPDFKGRQIEAASFVPNEDADGQGHGTHCIGTACGAANPASGPRYGIANGAVIFTAKVLANNRSGTDAWVLGGMNWAIENECDVISMSLGSPVEVNQEYSQLYNTVGTRALEYGALIIAATGNASNRNAGHTAPVSSPANCPSIMAVAAVDPNLLVAPFSNAGINVAGGQVDISGPGVSIYSAYLSPQNYTRMDGTSMATPHVSGIAALYIEATGLRGWALWSRLTQSARRLSQTAIDIGAGLVQAPT